MARTKTIVLDELHVTFRIPGDLPEDEAEEVREVLTRDEFAGRLRRAVRTVLREFPELNAVRVSLTR